MLQLLGLPGHRHVRTGRPRQPPLCPRPHHAWQCASAWAQPLAMPGPGEALASFPGCSEALATHLRQLKPDGPGAIS